MRTILFAGLILGAFAGAAFADDAAPTPTTCQASKFQNLVGEPQTALEDVTLPGPFQFIDPETPPAPDSNPMRLTIEFDADGVIVAVSCG